MKESTRKKLAKIRKKKSSPVVDCPIAKGAVCVVLFRSDTGEAIKNVDIELSGPSKASGKTDRLGIAEFKDLEPGNYQATVKFPDKLAHYNHADHREVSKNWTGGVGVAGNDVAVVQHQAYPTGKVEIEVFSLDRKSKEEKIEDIEEISLKNGPSPIGKRTPGANPHTFERVAVGSYIAEVRVPPKLYETGIKRTERSIVVKESRTTKTKLVFTRASNVVEPKIEVEFKTVLFDRGLSAHQDPAEDKHIADPTYIQVSAIQSNANPGYEKGAKLIVTPANVEVFTDEKCRDEDKFDLTKPIKNKKLFAGPVKLWLKGKSKGDFTLKLELEPTDNPDIELKEPAEEKMGVVEIESKLHGFVRSELARVDIAPAATMKATFKNLHKAELPVQKELTDQQKVKDGRVLHVQNGDHFGRARLLLKKLEKSQWPAGTDNYEVVVALDSASSGDFELYDKEENGSAVSLPLKVTVKDLKRRDKEFWVQGKAASTKALDTRLVVQMDRPAGGLAKNAKENADWARLTVVKVEEVKIDYTPPTGKANAWDAAEGKFYINFKDDVDGRKIKVVAKLSEKIEKIDLHFMLAPQKNNGKSDNWGINLPRTWKWNDIEAAVKTDDRSDQGKLLHVSVATDAEGNAEKALTLSRFGGDQFEPGVYLTQDAHLAKYVKDHSKLGIRKPVVADKTITVWRKFWYQPVKVEGLTVPAMTGAEGQYTRVKSTMTKVDDLDVTRATVDAMNPQAIYPKYMVRINGGNSDALVVADTNKTQFFTGFTAEDAKPLKIPILVADAQWDEDGDTGRFDEPGIAASNFPYAAEMDKLVLTPPLQGGNFVVSGKWEAAEKDDSHPTGWTNIRDGDFSDADVTIDPARDSLYKVNVSLPSAADPIKANTFVNIKNLVVQGAAGPYLGEYDGATGRILSVYDGSTALTRSDFQNTVAHELGHAFFQVSTSQPTGVPAHPKQYYSQGDHCKNLTNKCLMYESGPIAGSLNRYCDMCHPYVLIQDMSKLAPP